MDPENIGTEAIVRVTHWLRGIWEMRRRGGPVQQWVDSIPSYGNTTSSFSQQTGESSQTTQADIQTNSSTKDNLLFSKNKLRQKSGEMTASVPISIPSSPAITMTCPVSSVTHNRLARDPSLQSDSSHCSSVESLLEWRKADPEAILLGLGFGYPSSPQENGSMARIPRRFLQPSKLKGIAVDEFLKQQQESNESLDSASLGYRGLTGSPYVAPSEIVQKIMERLREHECHEVDSFTNTNSSSELFGSMQQDGRLSVLSPNNRQYLEQPRSKSPDMRNKRMIIGDKSFAFGYNGDLIEIKSLNKEERNFDGNSNDYQFNLNDPHIKLESEVCASDKTLKPEEYFEKERPRKLSGRRLAKQQSFDDDNSMYDSKDTMYTIDREELMSVDQIKGGKQRDSFVTVVSRWPESIETVTDNCDLIPQNSFDDTRPNLTSRRASDGLCDLNLKRNIPTPNEERRMSDSGIETKVQRFNQGDSTSGEKKNKSDKKPGLKRQARVNEADGLDCDGLATCKSSNILSTCVDKIDRYVSKNKTLGNPSDEDIESNVSRECGLRTVKLQDSHISSEDNEVKKSVLNKDSETEVSKRSCSDEQHRCCKNAELNQICEHEETSTDCCCHASNSNCWRKMSKILRKNQKLEDMVAKSRKEMAKSRQEMAELREMLNSVMSVRTEPGF